MRCSLLDMRLIRRLIAIIPVFSGLFFFALAHAGDPQKAKPATKQDALADISADAVRPHVEYLASPRLEGRGTARGKELARDYIEKQFQELRLEPLFGKAGYVQEIPGAKTKQGERTLLGKNLGAWLPGGDPVLRDEFVILSAHYDHL